MGKASKITLILLLVSLLFKQILSQDVGEHVAARTVKQEEEHGHKVHCSRERSRAAWQAIEEYLMPFVERERYQILSKCRLHPSNDLFRDQEEHKIHVDINEWKCGYCKKSFRAEKYLDQHFDNRHYNLLNIVRGHWSLVFLGDFDAYFARCFLSSSFNCKKCYIVDDIVGVEGCRGRDMVKETLQLLTELLMNSE